MGRGLIKNGQYLASDDKFKAFTKAPVNKEYIVRRSKEANLQLQASDMIVELDLFKGVQDDEVTK